MQDKTGSQHLRISLHACCRTAYTPVVHCWQREAGRARHPDDGDALGGRVAPSRTSTRRQPGARCGRSGCSALHLSPRCCQDSFPKTSSSTHVFCLLLQWPIRCCAKDDTFYAHDGTLFTESLICMP